ncbi:MAG: universal stress protein [Marinoscillum sp.]
MKRILVPTDFSDQAMFATVAAAGLAAKVGAEILLFHVLDEPEDTKELAVKLDRVLKHSSLAGVTHHYVQTLGDTIEEIAEEKADLIVMGSEGASGLESFFIGTNAEKVAKKASCPVIIIKSRTDLTRIKKIVFPTNMHKEDEEILGYVKELQSFHKAHLHLVKVFDDLITPESDVKKRLKDYAEFHKIKDYSVKAIPGTDEADEILEYSESLNADLIAIATHDRKGLDRIFAGHISGEVINESRIPIWTKSLDTPV